LISKKQTKAKAIQKHTAGARVTTWTVTNWFNKRISYQISDWNNVSTKSLGLTLQLQTKQFDET